MKTLRSKSGFTLTELLVSSLVGLVFGLAGLNYYRGQTKALTTQSAMVDATDKLRAAMTFMTREIRLAGYDPQQTAMTVSGKKGIVDARSDFLWIQFDRNENGAIATDATDPSAESVAYAYDSANQQIVRNVAGVTQTLIKNVPPGTFSFQYFDESGNALTLGTVAFTAPSGLPSAIISAVSAEQGVIATQRDQIALVRVSFQVQTVGLTPSVNLTLSSRVSVPARTTDRL
jgi:prepilin-type N-terminal cleavage/methylation domain-containing protein